MSNLKYRVENLWSTRTQDISLVKQNNLLKLTECPRPYHMFEFEILLLHLLTSRKLNFGKYLKSHVASFDL
jgi:hypothetical protein